MIEKDIFKKSLPDHDKLLEYGFSCVDSKYSLKKKILGSFEIRVCIENDNVLGSIYDLEMEDEYLGFRIEDNIGEFAGNIRNEFIKLLTDIRDKCFISEYFVGSQANRISNMIISKFGDYPSFEWDNYPDFGVFKNNDSKKWYALIMNINRNKIDTGNEMVDVLNVKIDPDKIIKLLEKKLEKVSPEQIETPEPYIAVPALQYISYCMDNHELRDMYANLLASSMNKFIKNDVHPGYIEIIKQLCPDEAKILKYIAEKINIPTISLYYGSHINGGVCNSHPTVTRIPFIQLNIKFVRGVSSTSLCQLNRGLRCGGTG